MAGDTKSKEHEKWSDRALQFARRERRGFLVFLASLLLILLGCGVKISWVSIDSESRPAAACIGGIFLVGSFVWEFYRKIKGFWIVLVLGALVGGAVLYAAVRFLQMPAFKGSQPHGPQQPILTNTPARPLPTPNTNQNYQREYPKDRIQTAAVPTQGPRIISTAGSFTNLGTAVVTGIDFGFKDPARPILFANFDSSLAPSPLGLRASWDQTQSVVWSATEKCAMASNGSGVWTLRVDNPTWFQDGRQIYIYRRVKRSFQVTDRSQNYKSLRAWVDIGDVAYPNLYVAPSNGRVYVEGIADSGFWTSLEAFRWNTTSWNTEEIIIRASQIDRKNGSLTFRSNGRTTASDSIKTRSNSFPGVMQQLYALHEVIADRTNWSPSWSTNNRIWADDIYVDNTWARIQLGNADSYTNCTEFAIQIPIAWKTNEVTFRVNPGAFRSGQQVYLYVFNAQNEVNPRGVPITIGTLQQPVNVSPVVAITTPTNNALFVAPAQIQIQANASDADGTITRVDFIVNETNVVASDTSAPFSTVWTNAGPGSHQLTARATDNRGWSSTSAAILVNVLDGRQTLTLLPYVDTFLNINRSNYVTSATLSVYTWPDFRIANVSLIGVDLDDIPPQATITRGELRLHLIQSDSSTNALYRVPLHVLQTNVMWIAANGFTSGFNDWLSTNCCYQGAPMAQRELSPVYDSVLIDKQPGPKNWNVASAIQHALSRGQTNIVFALNSDESQLADRWRSFASLDHPNGVLRPEIVLEYTLPINLPPQVVLSSGKRLADGSYRFLITGTSNVTFRVESSPDLKVWAELAVISERSGEFVFTDTAVHTQKFYRVSIVK